VSSRGQQNRSFLRKPLDHALSIPAILLLCSLVLILVGGVSAAPPLPAPIPAQAKKWADQMPDGDGKKLIVAKCQLCHTLERVVTSHRTKDDWAAVIALMVEQGASLTDDESKTVVDYLVTNYPPKGEAAPAAGPAGASTTMIVDPDQTQFTAAPDSLALPKGVMMATVSGDPTKTGLFSILLRLPADQMIPAHWQSSDVDVVVLRGTYEVGNGDAFDAGKLQVVTPGQVVHIPAQSHHFAQAKGPAVVLLYGVGPLSITWAQ
jgi:quercetin dioxygenase-like cupin family protein